MSERLDRIEAALELLIQENRETRQLTESNARAIEALANNTTQDRAEFRASIQDVVNMVATVSESIDNLSERLDRQAQQAEIDRAEFRATVQQLLDALTQRFNSNGNS